MGHGTVGLTEVLRASPPLPNLAPAAPKRPPGDARLPAAGCYLLDYVPAGASFVAFDGTLRIEATDGGLLASGDLYQRDIVIADDSGSITLAPSPDPAAGIPILPIKSYRYYLRVTQIQGTGDGFSLAFETLRFSAEAVTLFDGSETNWPRESAFTALMAPVPAPASYKPPGDSFAGDVTNDAGTAVGRLSMAFVSPYLRKATIEIDRVPVSELPLDNGAEVTWRTVFDKVGWDITPLVSDSDVEEPSGEAWNKAEAHAAMLARRDRSDLDTEWRYHVLAVQLIDFVGGERGVMYDDGAGGTNRVPREGLMIASHWPIPDAEPWGLVKGMRAGTTVTYFRTAVHELGHAMGLSHNIVDHNFMRPTDGIAADSLQTPATPFPNNIQWSYSRDDEHRLRHWPDLVVRPGGTSMFSGQRAPISSFESEGHRLDVAPVLTSIPLGAPVRIDVSLVNTSDRPNAAPLSLSLTSGPVRGQVIDPSGTVRTFSPLVVDENTASTQSLAPGEHVDASLTLLRGAQGALFPTAGAYRIVVEVSWTLLGLVFFAVGETNVMVTAAVDVAHADAALKVLTTPEALLVLAFGGDHLKEGIEAVGVALNNDVLRPHFAYVEAKRLATRFGKRRPDLKAAAELIDETTVMSPAEFRKAAQMAKDDAKSDGGQAIAKTLKARVAKEPVSNELKALVHSL